MLDALSCVHVDAIPLSIVTQLVSLQMPPGERTPARVTAAREEWVDAGLVCGFRILGVAEGGDGSAAGYFIHPLCSRIVRRRAWAARRLLWTTLHLGSTTHCWRGGHCMLDRAVSQRRGAVGAGLLRVLYRQL